MLKRTQFLLLLGFVLADRPYIRKEKIITSWYPYKNKDNIYADPPPSNEIDRNKIFEHTLKQQP